MRFFAEQAGLLLSNGAMYGQGGEGFVRMNIGCPRKVVKEALERVKSNISVILGGKPTFLSWYKLLFEAGTNSFRKMGKTSNIRSEKWVE